MVRCVRYAFAHIPPRIGRVFFAREVALPFLRFRLLRHGFLGWPVGWREVREVTTYAIVGGWCVWLLLTVFPSAGFVASGWSKIARRDRTWCCITFMVRGLRTLGLLC